MVSDAHVQVSSGQLNAVDEIPQAGNDASQSQALETAAESGDSAEEDKDRRLVGGSSGS